MSGQTAPVESTASQQPICPRCGGPVEGVVCPAHGLYAVTPEAARRINDAPLLGQALADRYVLVDLIGLGGMGAIYRGIDNRLDRPVAVKVLMAQVATDEFRRRFESEARALSKLRSEFTVTIHDYGVETVSGSEMPYIVMELVAGESLEQRLEREALTPAEASGIVTDVARSLGEAHAAGIIHRDVKTSNILLAARPDGSPIAKVIDFGIARVVGGRHTQAGVLMGTPHYMAPEQCDADLGEVDERTDTYALSIVLFEMLAGTVPFDHPQAMSVVIMQIHNPPPPLPGHPRNALRADLEVVVHRGMAKDQGERLASVAVLARAVSEAVERHTAAAQVLLSQDRDTMPQPITGARSQMPTLVQQLSRSAESRGADALDDLGTRRRPRWPYVAAIATLAAGALLALIFLGGGEKPPESVVVPIGQVRLTPKPAALVDAGAIAEDASQPAVKTKRRRRRRRKPRRKKVRKPFQNGGNGR